MAEQPDIDALIRELERIVTHASELEARFADALERVHPQFADGARNLIAYVAMRHVDIREVQKQLARLGLSSLGSAEPSVLASIETVLGLLKAIAHRSDFVPMTDVDRLEQSEQRLRRHVADVLGPPRGKRETRIMVTLPARAAGAPDLIHAMLKGGMDIARINCAHDDEDTWRQLVDNVRSASAETGRSCRIAMDLAGPKMRTGDMRPGPGVMRFRPKRDASGRTRTPWRVKLVPEQDYLLRPDVSVIPVTRACCETAAVGDTIRFSDARGKHRRLRVIRNDDRGVVAECAKTTYLASGTRLVLESAEGRETEYKVGTLPPTDNPIVLYEGDELVLHARATPGEPARTDEDGSVVAPAHIACRQPEVFQFVAEGQAVLFNDGKIEGVVRSRSDDELSIEITRAKRRGSRLRADRGINFPDSTIMIGGLTATDRKNLGFVAANADAVGLSFVRSPEDVRELHAALDEHGADDLGVIIKIETVAAFNDLPRILLVAMQRYPAAIMIARGDLAVECGWESLAELQEVILWMCEAAEMPVIWATQVLEHEAKTGLPSRAEITDAAMSQRADCVMLNKGPHIRAAIKTLNKILSRMQAHQHKKSPTLQKLGISDL